MNFEWDEKKNKINIKKHGISFQEASSVFSDENAILFDDVVHSRVEERFLLLGLSDRASLCIVVHCYRENDEIIRIISARPATKNETNTYNKYSKGWGKL